MRCGRYIGSSVVISVLLAGFPLPAYAAEAPSGVRAYTGAASLDGSPIYALTLLLALIVIAGLIAANIFIRKYLRQKKSLEMLQELPAKDEKIKEIKDRLERVINVAPAAYMLTIDGVVMETNEYMIRNFGMRPGDYALSLYANPDQRDFIIEHSIEQGLLENQIVKFKMPDGSDRRFVANITTIEYEGKPAHMLWAMDVEQDEMKNDQLRMARESLELVLDTMPVAVRIDDLNDRKLLYANKALLEIFRCGTVEDLIGSTTISFMPELQPGGVKTLDRVNEMMDTDGRATAEFQCLRSDGELFDASITSCKIDYMGIRSSLAVIEDLTAENEYQRMLRDTAEREKEANQLKSRFLVNMSHEIRTPMNTIIGLSEIELHKKLPKEARDVYTKINSSAKHLLEIINDILDLSKIEADKIELFDDEFELEELLGGAMMVAAPRIEAKDVEFLLNVSLDLPRFVIGDKTRLWQILKNFLDNAAKYTERGKIVMTVFENHRLSNPDTIYISFIIEDTGIGIGEEQLQRVFYPYTQIYSEVQKKYTGTGLGMAISKQLCELMGGTLNIDSKISVGTSIYVTIPFKRTQNNDTELQNINAPMLAGLNMLAVDDNELALQIMTSLLEKNNVNCEIARSGKEAIEIIFEHRSRGKHFDVVLLDYMMEGINGMETARQIQAGLSKVPKLLMVTGYHKEFRKQELTDGGIVDIIEKPFIPSHFIRSICTVLGYGNDNGRNSDTVVTYQDVEVLLIEDYKLNQEVASGMFRQFGIATVIAENGREGIETLYSGRRFDLIFMDLQMPVMDGFETARAIRSDPSFNDIPIISLSADAMKETTVKCLEAGMNDNIPKPIEFSKLNDIFIKWLPESKRVLEPELRESDYDKHDEALRRFEGDKKRYKEALRTFAGDLPDKWPEFHDAVLNIEETKRIVHGLKGAAGTLALTDMYNCAIELEKTLRAGAPDDDLYRYLVDLCNAFKENIAAEAEALSEALREQGTPDELRELLGNLHGALEDCNPKLCSALITSIRAKTWYGTDEEKLERLCELGLKYEFDAALDMLASIIPAGNSDA